VGYIHEGYIFALILKLAQDHTLHLRGIEGAEVGEKSDDHHYIPLLGGGLVISAVIIPPFFQLLHKFPKMPMPILSASANLARYRATAEPILPAPPKMSARNFVTSSRISVT
jgi:hypothetical protein